MANVLSYDQSAYSKVERGDRGINFEILILLKERLDVNTNWLIDGKGEMFLPPQNEEKQISNYELTIYDKVEMEIIQRLRQNPKLRQLVYGLTKADTTR